MLNFSDFYVTSNTFNRNNINRIKCVLQQQQQQQLQIISISCTLSLNYKTLIYENEML